MLNSGIHQLQITHNSLASETTNYYISYNLNVTESLKNYFLLYKSKEEL